MKKSRFTETQIIAVLKQVAAGQECERVRPAGGGQLQRHHAHLQRYSGRSFSA